MININGKMTLKRFFDLPPYGDGCMVALFTSCSLAVAAVTFAGSLNDSGVSTNESSVEEEKQDSCVLNGEPIHVRHLSR